MTHEALPPRLILFDGVCGFCDQSVQFILDHDPLGRFSFTPLQGETAEALRARHPRFPRDIDTMVYVRTDASGEELLLRSRAVFAICGDLGGLWRLLAPLRWLPAAFTDLFYRAFAAVRYRIFGKVDACRLLAPEERGRFLP